MSHKYPEVVTRGVGADKVEARALATMRFRVPLARPLTERQLLVAACLGEGYTTRHTAALLACTERTIRFHVRRAAEKIPGDLPPMIRLVVWYRGGDMVVLTGKFLLDSPPLSSVTDVPQPRSALSSPADTASSPPTCEV